MMLYLRCPIKKEINCYRAIKHFSSRFYTLRGDEEDQIFFDFFSFGNKVKSKKIENHVSSCFLLSSMTLDCSFCSKFFFFMSQAV